MDNGQLILLAHVPTESVNAGFLPAAAGPRLIEINFAEVRRSGRRADLGPRWEERLLH